MAEVEDVAGAVFGAAQHVADAVADGLPGREEEDGVEVALHALVVTDALPGVVEVDAPVEAHDVAAGVAHQVEQRRVPGAEVDGGNAGLADGIEDAGHVGQHRRLVLAGAQDADPAIEDLDNLGAGGDLLPEVADDDLRGLVHERRPEVGAGEHESLGLVVVAGGPALDHVAGKGEGGAGEADERGAAVELPPDKADGVEEIGGGLGGVDDADGVNLGLGAYGVVDDGGRCRARCGRARPCPRGEA